VQRVSWTCLRFNALNEPFDRPIPPAVCAHILARGHIVHCWRYRTTAVTAAAATATATATIDDRQLPDQSRVHLFSI